MIAARNAPAQSQAVKKNCGATGSDFAHAALAQLVRVQIGAGWL
jgi:hypothetical protein